MSDVVTDAAKCGNLDVILQALKRASVIDFEAIIIVVAKC
jgi:hypothetical protein